MCKQAMIASWMRVAIVMHAPGVVFGLGVVVASSTQQHDEHLCHHRYRTQSWIQSAASADLPDFRLAAGGCLLNVHVASQVGAAKQAPQLGQHINEDGCRVAAEAGLSAAGRDIGTVKGNARCLSACFSLHNTRPSSDMLAIVKLGQTCNWRSIVANSVDLAPSK